MSTTPRIIASVLALIAALGALYALVSPKPTPAPVSTPMDTTEAMVWTDEDFPIRVTNTPEGKRVEIAGYVDLECLGCTDEQAVLKAQAIMSDAIMRSLTIGDCFYVGEGAAGDPPAYVSAILQDEGWAGRLGDGRSCLYPPLHRPIAS